MIRTPYQDFDFAGETSYPTTEGSYLQISECDATRGQIEMGVHHREDTDDLPSDILYTRFRIPDCEGIIWESESRFGSHILVEKMSELSTPTQLMAWEDVEPEFRATLEGPEVLRGIRFSSDDRIYRSLLIGDTVHSVQFKYTRLTLDLAFHPMKIGPTLLCAKIHENSLFVGRESLGPLYFSTFPFVGPNTAFYNEEEEWWQENSVPAPSPFRQTDETHQPNENVRILPSV